MLELPITVRVPLPEEMPHREDMAELLQRRQEANIVQGFTFSLNTTQQLPFSFYAEINIDNSRLWHLFLALSGELPQEIRCEYGPAQDEMLITDYFPKEKVLQKLSLFKPELVQDCFLEFGLLHHTKTEMIELFVSESKYIRYWGIDETLFRNCMKDFDIPEMKRLAFIDEFPKIVEPLNKFVPTARLASEVIRELDRLFNVSRTSDDWEIDF